MLHHYLYIVLAIYRGSVIRDKSLSIRSVIEEKEEKRKNTTVRRQQSLDASLCDAFIRLRRHMRKAYLLLCTV